VKFTISLVDLPLEVFPIFSIRVNASLLLDASFSIREKRNEFPLVSRTIIPSASALSIPAHPDSKTGIIRTLIPETFRYLVS